MTSGKLRLDLFQWAALVTTLTTYGLIAMGALVRASGSGLGCPDWPKCFGRWIPPISAAGVPPPIDPATFNFAKAWTEYTNRLLGVATGFLIFGTLVLAIMYHRRSKRILLSTLAAFVLTGVEGVIGGKVVASKLEPLVLTVHLVFALAIVSLLLYATVSAFFPKGTADGPSGALGRITIAVALLALTQIGIGAALRGEVQLAGLEHSGLVRIVHQNFSVLVAAAIGYLAWYVHAKAEPDRWIRGIALATVALVALQAAAGWGMTAYALPPALQVAHLWIGSLLLGALTVLALLAYRLDPRRALH